MSISRAVSLTLLSVGVGATAQAQEPSPSLSMQARQKLALVVITPGGGRPMLPVSDVVRELKGYFDDKTDLRADEGLVAANDIASCQGSLQCMVKRTRSDYTPTEAERQGPYSGYLDRIRREKKSYPVYLVLLTVLTEDQQPDQMNAMLINTDVAMRHIHEGKTGEDELIESRILESAVMVRTKRKALMDSGAAKLYLEALVNVEFKAVLDRSGNWEPFGAIALTTNQGLEIAVDGQTIGTTSPGITQIVDVPTGAHKLTLKHPDYELYSSDVEVTRGQTTQVNADVLARASALGLTPAGVTFWGGVGVATVGAVFTTLAVVHMTSNSDVRSFCVASEPAQACDEGKVWWTLSSVFKGEPERSFGEANEGSILAAPFGYSLMGTGAVIAVGTELMHEDPDEVPWIPIAAGFGVGIVSYVLSALLAPSSTAN